MNKTFLNKKIKLCFFLILLLGFILGFYNLSERSFDFYDEAYYANEAGSIIILLEYTLSNWKGIISGNIDKEEIRTRITQNSPAIFGKSGKPVHALILSSGALLFGFNEFSLFFLMLLINLLSLIVLYKICDILFDYSVGLFSAFFFSISGIMTFFARTTMPQTVMVFFCLVAFYSSLKIGKKNWNLLFGLSSALAFFTHPSTGLILLSVWIFAGISVSKLNRMTRIKTLKHILISAGIPSLIFVIITELPYILFSGFINQPGSYVSAIIYRATKSGTEKGGIPQVPFLFKNIWESEFLAVAFIAVGIALILIRFNKLDQIKILIIPFVFSFLYFLLFPIKYRFRIFILIYPFLHIVGGVALGYIFNKLSYSSDRRHLFLKASVKVSLIFVLLITLVFSLSRLANFNTSNKKSMHQLCSSLDTYLANLPQNETKDITDDQGHLSTIIQFYFAKNRIKHLYPALTKSMIWDWAKKRPDKDPYGDIIILFEDLGFSDQLPQEKIRQIIGNKQPIIKIPYKVILRSGYFDTPFKTKQVYIEIYDLKS